MSLIITEHNVVQHFTHAHQLTKVDRFGDFTCDGCKTYGNGKAYRCSHCNYDLHDYCATCPATHLSFMHPQHHLRLVTRGPPTRLRVCDICCKSVQGLFYRCETCDFDVHTLCTRLPQHVRHVPHSAHPLELSPSGASNTCNVCSRMINSWRYKCGPCRLDVHIECVDSAASVVYNNHAHDTNQYGYNNHAHTNPRPSIGKRILKKVIMGVICNIISAQFPGLDLSDALSGFF